MKLRFRGNWIMTGLCLVIILGVALLSGCQNKDAAMNAPVVESEAAELTFAPETKGEKANVPGNGDSSLQENGKKAESSVKEADVTKETAPAFQAVDETVYITASQVNVRVTYSTDGEIVGRLSNGESIKRVGYSETWSKVIYKEKERYISSQYLSKTPPETKAAPAVSGSGTGKIIAIDAGHQAKGNSSKEPDGPGSSTMKAKVASGTEGVSTKIAEYKLTLAVSKLLKEELENRGYKTLMIRETHDVDISNAERAEIANNSGADIFVRVHANSVTDSSVHGALTMCMTSKNPYNASLYSKSSSLSKKVTDAICNTTGFKNRGVQETDTMSGINWCKIPVTIVEMGFMSNAEEDQKMATEEYQKKIAQGIADGIDAYYAAGN